ncbi:hypothetical protein LZ554_003490 [Drepanopeziza brunnea f. sp. 'monogermtubi']|nr:hypothetical protein LZ554_003490 [Drepanopeziza brunnea f. sp. 'monogermtubi']
MSDPSRYELRCEDTSNTRVQVSGDALAEMMKATLDMTNPDTKESLFPIFDGGWISTKAMILTSRGERWNKLTPEWSTTSVGMKTPSGCSLRLQDFKTSRGESSGSLVKLSGP